MISNHIGVLIAGSSLYQTTAWGNEDQASFLNKALSVSTSLSAEEILAEIGLIETKMGRVREEQWGPRIIDIDIIFYNEEIIENPNLKIPHPQLTNRNFVLVPLLELCPNKIHPILQKSVKRLAEECTDKGKVERL